MRKAVLLGLTVLVLAVIIIAAIEVYHPGAPLHAASSTSSTSTFCGC